MFNKYMWQLYLKSGGNETVQCFEDNFKGDFTLEYADFIYKLHSVYHPKGFYLYEENEQLKDLYTRLESGDIIIDELIGDDFSAAFLSLCDGDPNNVKSGFDNFSWCIAYYSTLLAMIDPETYIPYYFYLNFNVLQIIADNFEITLPELPKKSDYESRAFYYEELCDVLQDFRKANDLSVYELYAFLYDFAPKSIGGMSSYIISELPEPRSAYFIGGSKDDVFLSDDSNTITLWQCSPDTRAGDMIVMYLRSPVSAVDSVWRSCSVGFIDPFFYYYRCTYICKPQKLKPIPLDTVRTDKILGTMPIVKKNMQGINGVELKPSEYNRILKLGRSKAISLEIANVKSKGEYSTEKEVENNVIKPLLSKIGYKESDYIQQLYIEIGNHNHALIPDFVLLPEKSGNRRSAFAVVEAKRSITNQQQLEDALLQARGYAKLLSAEYVSVISQEKVWIYSAKDDLVKVILEIPVGNMSDDELFSIRKLIGKNKSR